MAISVSAPAILVGTISGAGLVGVSAPRLAAAISAGLVTYMTGGVTVLTVDAGTLGVGIGVGLGILLTVPTILGALTANLIGQNINGISMPSLASGTASGISASLATANILTSHPTVGVGTGVVRLVPNPAASLSAFLAGFAGAGLTGVSAAKLALAISVALDSVLASAIAQVVISGSTSPIPSTGVGTGKIL